MEGDLANTINAKAIDTKIFSILSEHSEKKLLSMGAGLTIHSLLLIHPSPQFIIKTIVSQRCTEDLITLFALLPPALKIIQKQFPKSKPTDWLDKIDLIYNKLFCHESLPFNNFMNSLSDYQKNLESYKQSSTKLVDEYINNQSLDIEKYISTHRELLSYGTDVYMLFLIVNQKEGTDEDYEILVNTVWLFREALAVFREKVSYVQ